MVVVGRPMKPLREKLGGGAAVKGTMLQAHMAWAADRLGPAWKARLQPHLDAFGTARVDRDVLATEWIPLALLVQIDRAIARETGGVPERVFGELGRHSATINLGGVYKAFVPDEPHTFFEQMAFLHDRFLNFGRCAYGRSGPRAGRIRMEDYPEYSPVFCASAMGYYEGALLTMRVPGPVVVKEASCQCAGDEACAFEMAW
jgi:hypothetical protein